IISIPTDVPEGLSATYRIAKGAVVLDDGSKSSFSGKVTTTCSSPFNIEVETMVVGSNGANIIVTAVDGSPAENVNVYTSAGELIGTTDAEGKLFTDKFTNAVKSFSIYAEKEGSRSFLTTTQSFQSGADAGGYPSYVKLNATVNPTTSQSISWMSSALNSDAKAVVYYAEKADYEAQGDAAFKTFEGESVISEMASSGSIENNYAVRINNAVVTGLKSGCEYVYKVGDCVKMSDVKSFTTTKNGAPVNFFVIGDTQATDTTNTDEITKLLANSGVKYDFGIQTGDAVDNGGNYKMWANIAKVLSGDFLGNQDMIQVLGNHEYYGDLTGKNAAAYFNLPNTNGDNAPICYSTQYGNTYVAVINYAGPETYKAAAEWIKSDAANTNAQWKILAVHQPPYYTNPSGNSASTAEIFRELCDEAGFDFVFSGHDHSFARTVAMTGGEKDKNGTAYYICGSTGEKSYEIVNNPKFNFEAFDEDYNAIYLTASSTDTELTVTVYDYTGRGVEVIDTYTKTKEVTCTENGHDVTFADGELYCSKCNYPFDNAKYTGFATDAATGKNMYFVSGAARIGWQFIGDDYYYFDNNGLAVSGTKDIDGVKGYKFDESGKQIGIAFVKKSDGTVGYRGGVLLHGWCESNGDLYYFSTAENGYMRTGSTTIRIRTGQKLEYTFSRDGKLTRGAFLSNEDGTLYYWGSEAVGGWQEIDGEKYYFNPSTGFMATDNTEINGKVYAFSSDGIFKHEGAHNWEEWLVIVKPNCTVDGEIMYACRICGDEVKTVITPAPGHIDMDGDEKCDTCGKDVDSSDSDNVFYKLINRFLVIFRWLERVFAKMFGK
ncbi:MAG: metallophosphoesterase, partial [Faecalibacterium sp.]|nr:metallophosphoesterase [Faecalibacterium sp.]